MRKLSKQQFYTLATLGGDPRGGTLFSNPNGSYMPWLIEQRTFDALLKHPLITYQRVEDGFQYNRYVINEAGREYLKRA